MSAKRRRPREGDQLDDDDTIVIGAAFSIGVVVRVVAVDDDGQVHFAILAGSVAKNVHLLDRTVA